MARPLEVSREVKAGPGATPDRHPHAWCLHLLLVALVLLFLLTLAACHELRHGDRALAVLIAAAAATGAGLCGVCLRPAVAVVRLRGGRVLLDVLPARGALVPLHGLEAIGLEFRRLLLRLSLGTWLCLWLRLGLLRRLLLGACLWLCLLYTSPSPRD